MDLATLGMEIDSSQVKTGVSELDRLTAAGAKAEGAVDRLGDAAAQTGAQVKGASAQAATYAANAQRMAANAMATGSSMVTMGKSTGLAAHHVQNLAFQANDLAVQLASGANPMMAFVQQGSQIAGIMSQAGLGVGGFAKAIATMLGLLKTQVPAELASAAASAKAQEAVAAAAVRRAKATIALIREEIILAESSLAVATTTAAETAATNALTEARIRLAAMSGEVVLSERALAAAQVQTAEASSAAAAATRHRIAGMGVAFGALAVAAGLALGAVKLFQSEVDSGGELDRYARSLGLTKKELKELEKEVGGFGMTASATFKGLWMTIDEGLGLSKIFASIKNWAVDAFKFALDAATVAGSGIYAAFAGSFEAARILWKRFPAVMGDIFVTAVNLAITAIEGLVNAGINAVNAMAQRANSLLAQIPENIRQALGIGTLGMLDPITFARIQNENAGAAAKAAGDIGDAYSSAFDRAQDAQTGFWKRVRENALKARKDEILDAANAIKDDRSDPRAKKDREKKEKLSEAEKAYRAALKAAQDFEKQLIRETDLIGKNAVEQKRYEVAIAAATARKAAAAAPSQKQKEALLAEAEAIVKAGQAWEMVFKNNQAAEFIKNRVEALEFENSIIGKSAVEQANLRAEWEQTLAQRELVDQMIDKGSEAWNRYTAAVQAASAAEAGFAAGEALVDQMRLVADETANVADIMSSAFGSIGDVIGGLITSVGDYRAEKAALALEVKKGGKTQEEVDRRLSILNAKNTAQAISGVKSLFKEKSTAYKVMQAIEMAYAAFQIVNMVKSMAMDSAQTASSVANSATRAAADQAAGGAKIFSQLGVWAFPVVAAMVAVLAALGLRKGGGGGGSPSIPNIEDVQAAQGTGTVLGDAKAKSNSIANSLEIVAANTNRDLEFSSAMLKALQSIDFSIARMAGTVARQIQVAGSVFDTSKLPLGTTSKGGFLGLTGKTNTKELYDLGIQLNSASVASIIANGITGLTYQVIKETQTKKGIFGSKTKTDLDTIRGSLPSEIASAIQAVVTSLRDGLVAAADVIGLTGAQAILDSFNVSLGKISFMGMTGEQIEDQLNAIFSSVGDQMAGKLLPSLKEMQLVGEGLFETFMRIAREYEVVDTALESIGKTFGAVGVASIAARDNLVQLFGGLEEFVEATDFFRSEFLSEAEQMAPIAASVRAEMARLGLAAVDTRDEFKAAVLGLDLTTQAGRDMYAALLAVAPAFDKVLDYFEKANKAQIDALQDTADKFNGFAASLKKYRDSLFATDAAQQTYAQLRARFASTATLAAAGDATGLGALEGAGKDFLAAAKNNASSLQQYLRDVAFVAQGVDKGIFAAEATADYAQLQLDALENATSILGTIAQNTAATASALGATPAVPVPAGPAPTNSTPAPSPTDQAMLDELRALRADNAQMRETLNQMQRLWTRFDGDGLLIRTDEDTPIHTEVVTP